LNDSHLARLLTVGLFISIATFSVQAQKIEVGAGLGGMIYKGDVSPTLNPRFIQPGADLFFRYNFTRSFSARAGVGFGWITASDAKSRDAFQQARDYAFKTRLGEATLDAEYFFRDYRQVRRVKNWSPYVFAGLGLVQYKTTNVHGTQLVYPLGVGIRYEIKRPWNVGLEFGTRFTSTDYLDGLGPETFGPNPTKLQQQNPAQKDSYSYISLKVSYIFYKVVCP
jgi:opacity protein-like surface antigen